MTRALLVAACACVTGCVDWEGALARYQELTTPVVDSGTPVPDAGTPNGAQCERDWECGSGQCLAGVCEPAGTRSPSVDGGCADLNDCPNLYVCEARTTARYTCALNTACLLESRLCAQDIDCCPGGNCLANNCVASKCISGVCRQSPATCKKAGDACARPEECCAGTGCGPSDGGTTTCQPADAGQLPDGFMCSTVDACQTTKCGGSPVRCQPASVTGSGLGQACGAGCYAAAGNAYECNANRCCVQTGKQCLANSTCCSGVCLDGFCAIQGSCRTYGLGCRENGDCCSGVCSNGACGAACGAPGESCAAPGGCCWGSCGDAGVCVNP